MRGAMRGFTMLELLVAISLMALLAGSLYGSLYLGFRAHAGAVRAVAPARTAALALELLQRDFDGAMPPTGVLAGAFTGSASSASDESSTLSFVSCGNVPNSDEAGCDMRMVELSVESVPDEMQPVLMRRVTTNLLASNPPVPREQILCRHVKLFMVRYYDGTSWQDTWDSTGQDNLLPLAVEVTLEFAPDEARSEGTEQTYRLAHVYRIPCGRVLGTN